MNEEQDISTEIKTGAFSEEFYSKTDAEINQDSYDFNEPTSTKDAAPEQTEEEKQAAIESLVEAGDFENLSKQMNTELADLGVEEDSRGMVESLTEIANSGNENLRIWASEMLVWTGDMYRYLKGLEDGVF